MLKNLLFSILKLIKIHKKTQKQNILRRRCNNDVLLHHRKKCYATWMTAVGQDVMNCTVIPRPRLKFTKKLVWVHLVVKGMQKC